MSIYYDYIIIGAGPVGATASLLISKEDNAKILLLERRDSVKKIPKAVHLDATSIQILNDIGVTEYKKYPLQEVIYDFGKEKIILDNNTLKQTIEYNGSCWFTQWELEREIWNKLEKTSNIDFNKGENVVNVLCDKDFIEVQTSMNRYFGKKLIAADGTNSIVKKILNINSKNILNFSQNWVVFDFIDNTSSLPDTHIQYCNSKTPFTYIKYGNNVRIEVKENCGDFSSILNKYFNVEIDYVSSKELLKQNKYKFTSSIINNMFYKNCFFIGDSSHSMPPFAGKGLCSGLKDSISLAYCLKNQKLLLENYLKEQRAENKKNIVLSVLLGYIITSKLNIKLKSFIFKISLRFSNFFKTFNYKKNIIGVRSLLSGTYIHDLLIDTSILHNLNSYRNYILIINTDLVKEYKNIYNPFYTRIDVGFNINFRKFVTRKNIEYILVRPDYKILTYGKVKNLEKQILILKKIL